MRVSQVLCAAGPVDAVTNQAVACRQLFDRWGWDGADFAAVLAPGMEGSTIRPLRELEPAADHVVLLHYSGYAQHIEHVLRAARRSLLISHNITPARFFWAFEPAEGVRCELARGQLAELAGDADALAGVSDYNAAELRDGTDRDVDVIPVLFDRHGLGQAVARPAGPPTVLFVGRLAPHKRQDLVIRAFASYRRYQPDARLVLVGVPLSPAFEVRLRRLAEELAPGAVTIESSVSAERLRDHYRSADAFLCLSEHEGFCIPLLEAFHFGVPVIARDVGAVGEVVADAGLLLGDDDDLLTAVELLRIVIGEAELRATLGARAQLRLEKYDYTRTADRLRDTLTTLAAG